MINSGGIGRNLSIHEIAARLRDTMNVVEKHYIVENPLLNEVKAIKKHHEANVVNGQISQVDIPSGEWMQKDEAIFLLKQAWGTTPSWRALRDYLRPKGLLSRKGLERGKLSIDQTWVERMAKDYHPVQDYPISRSKLRKLQEGDNDLVIIGRFIAAPMDILMRLIKKGP
jgi:hypothetical protein